MYKGRTVFLGDQVRDQDNRTAIFEEISSAPAAMEAGRICDMYGSLPDHKLTYADGAQAYVQARLKGPATWVEIPRMHWPASWYNADGSDRFSRPVVILHKALYGHPNAGAYCESECHDRVTSIGYVAIPEWPSVFWHPARRMLLVVYVDYKLARQAIHHDIAWAEIRARIDITLPEPVGHFLGCNQSAGTVTLPDGIVVNTMTYEMSSFLASCVRQCLDLSGRTESDWRSVSTPYLPDESGIGPARVPCADGPARCSSTTPTLSVRAITDACALMASIICPAIVWIIRRLSLHISHVMVRT